MKKRLQHNILRLLSLLTVHCSLLTVNCSLLTVLCSLFTVTSCIEPPLKLPAQEVIVDLQVNVINLDVVWGIDNSWKDRFYYGWDEKDDELFGPIESPKPTNYEVRRHYRGEQRADNILSMDGFTVFGNRFRRSYLFGYYDMLIWSNIDSKDGSQVLTIDETNPLSIQASTSVTRGISRGKDPNADSRSVIALFNQPEIFYSSYPHDIHISRDMEDYDYYDEAEKCWVKNVNCQLNPLVYTYLVQVILTHNDGRVVGTSGNASLSSVASTVNVNTGRTGNSPAMVYFNTRYKEDRVYQGAPASILGGKLTTFGLCDMASFSDAPSHQYSGSRLDLKNQLMVDFSFRNGVEKTMTFDVTDQCRPQAHGGVITIVLDCRDIDIPDKPEEGTGSLFVPTVEDYDEVIYEIPIGY